MLLKQCLIAQKANHNRKKAKNLSSDEIEGLKLILSLNVRAKTMLTRSLIKNIVFVVMHWVLSKH